MEVVFAVYKISEKIYPKSEGIRLSGWNVKTLF